MPPIVACVACQTKLKVPENAAVKALRCPKCKAVVPLAPPKPKTPPPPEPKEEEFEVNEAADEKEEEFEVNEAADEKDEEFEVNQAADESAKDDEEEGKEAEPDEDSALAELGFAKAKDVFKKGNIPDDARKAIEKAFTKKEKALWAGRPSLEIIESKAWIGLVMGPILALLGVSICIGMSVFAVVVDQVAIKLIGGGVALIFGVMFFGGGVAIVIFRKRIGGNVAACYVLTNKRAYVYSGTAGGVRAFNAAQLQRMRVEESSKFAGAGDLVFAYDFMGQGVDVNKEAVDRHGHGGQSTAVGFLAIQDVQTVKRLVEEVLLEPALDKVKAKKKAKKEQKESKNRKLFG